MNLEKLSYSPKIQNPLSHYTIQESGEHKIKGIEMLLWQLMFTEVTDHGLGPDPSDTTSTWVAGSEALCSSRAPGLPLNS